MPSLTGQQSLCNQTSYDHCKHLPLLLGRPKRPPHVVGRLADGLVPPEDGGDRVRHGRRLPQAARDAVPGRRVHQVGRGAERRHRLVRHRERAADGDVRPLLLYHPRHLGVAASCWCAVISPHSQVETAEAFRRHCAHQQGPHADTMRLGLDRMGQEAVVLIH